MELWVNELFCFASWLVFILFFYYGEFICVLLLTKFVYALLDTGEMCYQVPEFYYLINFK